MRLTVLFAFLLAGASLRAQSPYFPPTGSANWDTLSPASLGWCPDKLDSLVNYVGQTHAKAFLILKDGRLVVEKYYGSFTKDSIWYWASAGKTMMAFLTGLAQEQGALSINDSLPKYLGYGFSSETSPQESAIRIRHLLTMTSGFNNAYGGTSYDNHCTADTCLVYLAPPGTRWAYHNAPFSLLRWIINAATGVNVNVFKNNNLVARTGITGGFRPGSDPYDSTYFSSARAFARFALLIQAKGTWNGTVIMHDTAYFRQMTTTSQSLNPAYGYLFWLNGKSSYRIPGPQALYPGAITPHAPPDMISGLGKDDQIMNIVPSQGLVLIRMGAEMFPGGGQEVAAATNDSIWVRLNAAMCSQATGMREISPLSPAVQLVPNPTSGMLHIALRDGGIPKAATVSDAAGRQVAGAENTRDIDLGSLQPGVYFVGVTDQSGRKAVLRCLKY